MFKITTSAEKIRLIEEMESHFELLEKIETKTKIYNLHYLTQAVPPPPPPIIPTTSIVALRIGQ